MNHKNRKPMKIKYNGEILELEYRWRNQNYVTKNGSHVYWDNKFGKWLESCSDYDLIPTSDYEIL